MNLEQRYKTVKAEINNSIQVYARSPDAVRLVAVSKRHSVDSIKALAALGQQDFGENYLQEAVDKIVQINDEKLTWHFIGHIQSRKCKQIAQYFDWVHTVDSDKVAQKLNDARDGKPLNVLIQLNLQDESSKSGVNVRQTEDLIDTIDHLDHLRLRGLMIIPKPETDFEKQCAIFDECAKIHTRLGHGRKDFDQLSMGMSADLRAAIRCGSTQIRIGTAIFGPRPTTT